MPKIVELTEDEVKLCINALLTAAPQHRCPENSLAVKLTERLQPGTTFQGDPHYDQVSK